MTRSLVERLPAPLASPGWLRRSVLRRLERLHSGQLEWVEPGREARVFGRPTDDDLRARVVIEDPRAYAAVALGGSVGAGEAWAEGWWTSDDPVSVIRLFVRNRDVTEALEDGLSALAAPFRRLLHLFRRNTRAGSRRNIAAHYDLGDDFFRLFLDPTMMYSCAFFERPDATLEEASAAKLARICRKLELGPEDRVLEIGTGWGGFAVHAARAHGCRVTTTTISRRQFEFASRRVAEEGLESRVTVLDRDYRDLEGTFDKLVSIEMVEAVGADHLDTFLRTCSELLRPDGVLLLQAITLADRLYERALSRVDFIQKHVFPGSFIPSVTALVSSAARTSDLTPVHLEDLGLHYAETLRCWRESFLRRRHEARELGHSETFLRAWDYYLFYCEGGYREHQLGDVQILFSKPRRPRAVVPPGARDAA